MSEIPRFGEIAKSGEMVTPEEIEEALARQLGQKAGKKIGRILIE